jgi:tetratricopeptide (TPR) repeat protein
VSGLGFIKLSLVSGEAKPARGCFGPLARNAFRTLGLACTATQAEVFDAASSVRLALKLGVRKTFDGDLSWIEPVGRTESDVRDALGRLSEPRQRAVERLFWFHCRVTHAPISTVAELLRAVDALLSVDTGGTSDSGNSGSTSNRRDSGDSDNCGDSTTALHDAALLAVAGLACLDPTLKDAGAWARAFELWRQVFEGEEFWSRLVAADLKGDYEQSVTFGEVSELRARAPRLVSAPVAERARTASLHGDLSATTRALTILRGARLPVALLAEYERETVGPAEDGLIEKLDEALAWVNLMGFGGHSAATRRNYSNQAWRRFEAVRPRLADFSALAGSDSYFARRVFEHAASKLLRLAEAFDQAGRREESLFVCLKALALAPPDSEPLPAVEEKLRALGGGEEIRVREAEEYGEALARELADKRVPSKLFKDDPVGGKTLDSFMRKKDSSGGCLPAVLFWLAIAGSCFMLQWCGVIKTRPSRTPFDLPPRMTFTPEPLNLNLNLNYNIAPLNLNLRPYVVEPPGASRSRGRRHAHGRTSPRRTNESESPPLNLNGPANSNAPRQ